MTSERLYPRPHRSEAPTPPKVEYAVRRTVADEKTSHAWYAEGIWVH